MSVIVRRITGVSDSERILLVSVIPGGANEKRSRIITRPVRLTITGYVREMTRNAALTC